MFVSNFFNNISWSEKRLYVNIWKGDSSGSIFRMKQPAPFFKLSFLHYDVEFIVILRSVTSWFAHQRYMKWKIFSILWIGISTLEYFTASYSFIHAFPLEMIKYIRPLFYMNLHTISLVWAITTLCLTIVCSLITLEMTKHWKLLHQASFT